MMMMILILLLLIIIIHFFIIYELAQQPQGQFQIQHRNIRQIQKYNQQTKLHIKR